MEQKNIVLKAQGICKRFSQPAPLQILKGIDLSVYRGESISIMGRSGEGKSTLLQILGTLEDPSEGLLEIAGQQVTRINKTTIRNKNIAFIFQSFFLLEDYSVLENVLMPAKIGRQQTSKGSEMYQRCCFLLEQMGLSARLHFNVKLLSGGEKQRVAIARALCNDPDIILADEPSGNLDKQNAGTVHHLLLDFARQNNKSVIIVTHDQELAALCDKRYTLCDGHLI